MGGAVGRQIRRMAMSGEFVELEAWWQREFVKLANRVTALENEVASFRQDEGCKADAGSVDGTDHTWLMRQAGERLAERIRTISRVTGGAPDGPLLDWLCPPPKLNPKGQPVTMDDACRMATRHYAEEFLAKWKVMGKAHERR